MIKMIEKCILVAGMPGAGKTTFLSKLQKYHKNLHIISIDSIQEGLYESEGFSNKEEKQAIHKKAFELGLQQAINAIKSNKIPVLEYPFDNRHIERLRATFKNIDVLTIRLDIPIEKAYQNFHNRDLSGNRHQGHLYSSYPNIGNSLPQYQTFEDYSNAMNRQNVANFSLGTLLNIDASNFPFSDEHIFKYIDKNFLI